MTKVKVYKLNAFTLNNKGGNPAGVVIDANELSSNQMQKIASEVGLSETAFILPSQTSDYKLRFFAPSSEVDLCGHATIATYSLLHQLNKIIPGHYKQELKAGQLSLEIFENGQVRMEQTSPIFGEIFNASDVAEILGVSVANIDDSKIPIQIVSTGLPDVIVPIASREVLDSIKPNFSAMSGFNKSTETIGFHIFCINNNSKSPDAYCRNFAPLYEINEEAATGSASGGAACLISKYLGGLKHFEFEQGWSMNNASKIIVDLEKVNNTITQVFVSGYAGSYRETIVSV